MNIQKTNDETPDLLKNKVLQVQIGETRVISNRVLHAVDLDTDDSEILFQLIKPPINGQLVLSQTGKDDLVLREGDFFSEENGKN